MFVYALVGCVSHNKCFSCCDYMASNLYQWNMSMIFGEINTSRQNRSKTCPCHFVHHKFHTDWTKTTQAYEVGSQRTANGVSGGTAIYTQYNFTRSHSSLPPPLPVVYKETVHKELRSLTCVRVNFTVKVQYLWLPELLKLTCGLHTRHEVH
jgi:hypothetical protein